MKIPIQPRELRTLQIVRDFIIEEGINWLPVDPFSIAKKYGWGPDPVGLVSETTGWERNEVISGEDANTFLIKGKYKIIYNERVQTPDRIRWTIAHEIGHIVLGHLEEFSKTQFARGGLIDREYWVLEKEANLFAAELLSPIKVLETIGATTLQDISMVCRLSKEASMNRLTELVHRASKIEYVEAADFYKEQFKDFLSPVAVCTNSSKSYPKRHMTKLNKVRAMPMKQTYILFNKETNKFLVCPQCQNPEISDHANYCKMCGLSLMNICSNKEPFQKKEPCGAVNPADARYCEHCGSETVLFKKGLLTSWREDEHFKKIQEDQLERAHSQRY